MLKLEEVREIQKQRNALIPDRYELVRVLEGGVKVDSLDANGVPIIKVEGTDVKVAFAKGVERGLATYDLGVAKLKSDMVMNGITYAAGLPSLRLYAPKA